MLLTVGRDVHSRQTRVFNPAKIGDPNEAINKTCISSENVLAVVDRCTSGELPELSTQRFPWLIWSPDTPRGKRTRGEGSTRPGGVSDAIECQLFERVSSCLGMYGTPASCIIVAGAFSEFEVYKAFEFLCRKQARDGNFLRSLRCLRSTRLPTMVDYHITADCRHRMDFLQQQTLVWKRRQLHRQQVDVGGFTSLYCLRESALSACVHHVHDSVGQHCGSMAAETLLDYVHFQQGETKRALELFEMWSPGLCLKNT